MPKYGEKFDYDLAANYQLDGNERCLICDSELTCRWTDLHGEGVCTICGAPYQLMHGTEEQEKEGKYPYLRVKEEYISLFREYWNETHLFCFHGLSFTEDTGRAEFNEWIEQKHPELLKKKNTRSDIQ